MTDNRTAILLPLPALRPGDVLAEDVTVHGYTLFPQGWELSGKELTSLEEWGKTAVAVYADPTITGINHDRPNRSKPSNVSGVF